MKIQPQKTVNLITFCLILLFLNPSISKAGDDKNYNVKLQIINDKKVNNFLVKIAKNNQEREQGLMWVQNLPQNYGMIFEFEREQIIYMWMKNTKIPLDMIFIDKNSKIINIAKNTTPESLAIISSEKPVVKVLEINGGLAERLGVLVGDKVIY